VATKEAIVGKTAVCPISGLSGDCPFSEATSSSKSPASVDVQSKSFAPADEAEREKVDRVEKVLKRGSELLRETGADGEKSFIYAEVSYDKAIELAPLDWRGYYGKAVALQQQGKYFKAFQAVRRGCERLPESKILKEMEESTREAYRQAKAGAAEKLLVQQVPTPCSSDACPGAVATLPSAPVSRPFSGRIATKDERDDKKEMMLSIFREQWERIGKAKETMGYNDYNKEQQLGLKITGGHQPMPRPKDAVIPKDFRKPIGVISAEDMRQYHNCDCERLLLSIHGDIFDVSDRPDKYGKGAPYYYFSGRDITWGLVTGDDSEERVGMFFDIFKMDEEELNKKMQTLCSWTGFYEVEYGKRVGRLAEFEAEQDLPAPPEHKDECVVQ